MSTTLLAISGWRFVLRSRAAAVRKTAKLGEFNICGMLVRFGYLRMKYAMNIVYACTFWETYFAPLYGQDL